MLFNLIKIFFAAGFMVLIANSIQAQSVSATYTPGSGRNGPEVRVTVSYRFVNAFGEVDIPMSARVEAMSDAYWFKGKRYTSSEIGSEPFNNMRFFCADITADIFKDAFKVSTFSKNCVIQGFGSSLGESYRPGWSTKDIGGEGALQSYSIRNLRVSPKNFAENYYEFESAIAKFEKSQEENKNKERYQDLIGRADAAFRTDQLDEAEQLYREAIPLNQQTTYPRDQLAAIAKKRQDLKRNEAYQEKLDAGNQALAAKEYGTAKSAFQTALGLNDNPTEAREGLAKAEAGLKNEAEGQNKESENTAEKSGAETKAKQEADEEAKRLANREQQEREAEEQRRKMEYERQQRLKEYQQRNDEQRQENMAVASSAAASALALHVGVAMMLFDDVGQHQAENDFFASTLRFKAQAGYTATSAPIWQNFTQESYDGNTYTYDSDTRNYQTGTLDFAAAGEIWPVYSKTLGFGVQAGGYAGHGLLFQNFSWGLNGGFTAFAGDEALKLQVGYQTGIRNFSFFNWLEPTQTAYGKSRYNFNRYTVGPRFSWDQEKRVQAHNFSLLAIFENPSFRNLSRATPALLAFQNGVRIEYDNFHGIHAFGEYMWSYRRSGEIEYGFGEDASAGGDFFRVGFLRNFDMFMGSSLDLGYNESKKLLRRQNKLSVVLPSVGFSWLQQQGAIDVFNNGPKINVRVIGVEKEVDLRPGISLSAGVTASVLQGADFVRTTGTGGLWRIQEYGLEVPLQARLYLFRTALSNTWVSGGLRAFVPVYRQVQTRGTAVDDFFSDVDISNASFDAYRIHQLLGAGVDFPMGDGTLVRAGIMYDKGNKIIHPAHAPFATTGLHFLTAILF